MEAIHVEDASTAAPRQKRLPLYEPGEKGHYGESIFWRPLMHPCTDVFTAQEHANRSFPRLIRPSRPAKLKCVTDCYERSSTESRHLYWSMVQCQHLIDKCDEAQLTISRSTKAFMANTVKFCPHIGRPLFEDSRTMNTITNNISYL